MTNAEPESQPARPAWVWPVGLGIGAFAVRLVGIGWGLPNDLHHQSYHPDEHLLLTYALPLNPLAGAWDPHFYNYGSLWLYLMSFVARFGGGDPAAQGLACRLLAALLGSLTVSLTFLCGRRMGGFWAGLVAAALLALAPGPVVHSRFHTVDIPATFFVTAALLLAMRGAEEARAVKTVWGFALAGLAAAIKYNMALSALPLLAAIAIGPGTRQAKLRAVIFGAAALLAAFLITTPGAVLNSQQFSQDLRFEMNHVKEGHGMVFVNTPAAAVYHLGNLIESLGWGPVLLGLLGIGVALRNKDRNAWLLLSFAVPYYALIGGPGIEVKFLRYTLPLAPTFCLFAGYLFARGAGRTLVESRPAAMVGSVLLLSLATGNNLAVMTELMLQRDPRDRAVSAIPKPATIGLVTVPFFYTPPFFPDTGALYDPLSGLGGAPARLAMMEREAPRLRYYRPPAESGTPEWEPGLVREMKPEYVVYTSFESEDAARAALPGYIETMKLLTEGYDLQATYGFGGRMAHDMRYVSPQVFVWKRKT